MICENGLEECNRIESLTRMGRSHPYVMSAHLWLFCPPLCILHCVLFTPAFKASWCPLPSHGANVICAMPPKISPALPWPQGIHNLMILPLRPEISSPQRIVKSEAPLLRLTINYRLDPPRQSGRKKPAWKKHTSSRLALIDRWAAEFASPWRRNVHKGNIRSDDCVISSIGVLLSPSRHLSPKLPSDHKWQPQKILYVVIFHSYAIQNQLNLPHTIFYFGFTLQVIQGWAKRWSPSCVNAASKARQKWEKRAAIKLTKPGDRLLAESCT